MPSLSVYTAEAGTAIVLGLNITPDTLWTLCCVELTDEALSWAKLVVMWSVLLIKSGSKCLCLLFDICIND